MIIDLFVSQMTCCDMIIDYQNVALLYFALFYFALHCALQTASWISYYKLHLLSTVYVNNT